MDLRTNRPSVGAMKWMNKEFKDREREGERQTDREKEGGASGWRECQDSGQAGLGLPENKFGS